MKRALTIIFCLVLGLGVSAQEVRYIQDTTVTVQNVADINDYDLIGINYGVTYSQMQFNPPLKQDWLFNPLYVSLTYTHYLKLFQYMPYFGYSA